MRPLLLILLFVAIGGLWALGARAQELPGGQEGAWNAGWVLSLIERGRAERHGAFVDPDFRSYSAEARGYVYFFVDREDRPDNALVKTDQIALEVYWRAPGMTKQGIVGLRDEKQLPTNIQYHLDHLTVVQDEFDDRIRLGDGDEVSSVAHPLAPDAESVYEYRLKDSITVTLPGRSEPIRVYEIQVRPRFPDQPGFVGSIFLDRSTAALVRMQFTFTPASYVDPYLDYIRISLDNSLWEGRYWLPYRQTAELRRELPGLDMPVGSIIRGRYEIGGYEINPDLPEELFAGPPVTAVPEEDRESFPFETGLYDQVDREGLAPAPDMEEIRRQAGEMIRGQALSGLAPTRLYMPAVSRIARYNRAEGFYLGAGLTRTPTERSTATLMAGWAFARGKLALDGRWRWGDQSSRTTFEGYVNRISDIGPVQGVSGLYNSLSSVTGAADYLDPFFRSGVRIRQELRLEGQGRLRAEGWWERHRSGQNQVDQGEGEGLGPVLAVDDGDQWGGSLSLLWNDERALEFALTGTAAFHEGVGFGVADLEVEWRRDWRDRGATIEATFRGRATTPAAPAQSLSLLGGRSTLPGFPYRAFAGDAMWFVGGVGSQTLIHPWLRLRVLASAGQTAFRYNSVPEPWTGLDATAARMSVGAGLSLAWDVLRVDAVRGLGSAGEWDVIFSIDRRFWPWL